MPHMEPAIALSTSERALRQLMVTVFTEHCGSNWLREIAREDQIAKWREKSEAEEKKRTTRGVAAVSTSELDYAELYQLREIIEKHWQLFAPALGEKKVTASLLSRLDDLRNTVAHSREVLPFEADLLAGIAGEIRNRVTLYMSRQGPGGEDYPRIESVTDSFGNVLDGQLTLATSNPLIMPQQVLEVGDIVTFQCRGTDPQGQAINWSLANLPGDAHRESFMGNDGELRWTVSGRNVSERTYAQIRMTSAGQYHRWPEGWDGLAMFIYRVRPPR